MSEVQSKVEFSNNSQKMSNGNPEVIRGGLRVVQVHAGEDYGPFMEVPIISQGFSHVKMSFFCWSEGPPNGKFFLRLIREASN